MNSPHPSRRIAFLGAYVPRRCGIATFTHHICDAVAGQVGADQCLAVAVNDRSEGYDYPKMVRIEIAQRDIESYRAAADELNQSDAEVLCLQHEFGIYGGPAGNHVLALLKELRMPVVITLHTVLHQPGPDQRRVMDGLLRHSDRMVVMAQKGAEILKEVYGVDPAIIDVIPHGIPDLAFADPGPFKEQFGMAGKTVLLTYGLLGPNKGIEYAIRAMPEIVRRHPETAYLILGATHPHIVANEGEKYRTSLENLASDLGVDEQVVFFNRFVSSHDLRTFIAASDIYLTPYLHEAQITSGALASAFGAGKAVVSTPYWHALELLDGDSGILVPFRDSEAISEAVCRLLDNPADRERMSRKAYASSREMVWPVVAQRYLQSFEKALAKDRRPRPSVLGKTVPATRPGQLPPIRLEHLARMTDDTGIFQHAIYNVPNFHEGYCTDDNARAFLLCVKLQNLAILVPSVDLDLLATRYLAFLAAALNRTRGRFRNFMHHDRTWLEEIGSEDSHGRALWALGAGCFGSTNEGHRRICGELFENALPEVESFTSPRAWAFTLLGIHECERAFPGNFELRRHRDRLLRRLIDCWNSCAQDDWPWFETRLTYDNARLSQALILHGQQIPHPQALEIGLTSLRWLAGQQKAPSGHFRPIGSNGFHDMNGQRADFDQQPVEAQAMVAACQDAYHASGDSSWVREARRAFDWFLGRNDLNLPLYDPSSGGCRDGLHHNRANENQGAESTLAFQLALAELTAAEHATTSPLS